MGRINIGRLFLGGLVAGVVGDILAYLVDGVWLAPLWADGMAGLGHTEFMPNQLVWFNLLGLVTGFAIIWIYAAIRPRFGAGPLTAIYAGLAVWVVCFFVPNLSFMWVTGLFGRRLTAFTTAGGLVEVLAGALAGAFLYKES